MEATPTVFKRGRIFVLLVLVLWCPAMGSAGELTFEIKSPEIRVIRHKTGQSLYIQGGDSIEIPGVPSLPRKTVWALLPFETDEDSVAVRVENLESEPLSGTLDLGPVPPVISVSSQTVWWGEGKNIQNNRDMDVYTKNVEYPGVVVSVDHVSQLLDKKLARLSFFPVQYNPVTGRARKIIRAGFRLSFREKVLNREPIPQVSGIWQDRALPEPILNPEALEDEAAFSGLEKKDLSGTGYAVITTDSVLAALYAPGTGSALYDFSTHKTGLGFSVYLVTQTQTLSHTAGSVEAGYGTDEGQQRAVNIREWLKANHTGTEKAVKYVLLIGDPDPEDTTDPSDTFGDVPMLLCWPKITGNQWASTPETPTDYFFADLSGNWDLNGNGVYGEYPEDRGTGGIDFLPEVYVGRIPFSETGTIAGILQKTMAYESVTYTAGDNTALAWRKKAILPMSILSYGTSWYGCPNDISFTDEAFLGVSSQVHALHPNGFDTFLLTEQEGDPKYPDVGWHATSEIIGDAPLYKVTGASSGNILEHWWNGSDSWGIVFWSLHGSETSVARKNWTRVNPVYCPHFDSYFWRSHAAGLDDGRPAFLVSTACSVGHPEHSDAHGLSLGRELIRNGTLVALVNSREAWYTGGHFSDEEDGFLPGVTESTSDIRATVYYYTRHLARDVPAGDAVFYARQSKNAGVQAAWANNFVSNIYGDPSVKILPPGFKATDTDQDGLSDDEETYIYLSDPARADTDSDGLKDSEELTAHHGNWQVDLDQDGLDIFHDPDSDDDGLDDSLEADTLLTDPGNPDSDGDGLSDHDEVNRDGDPSNYLPGIDADPHNPDTDGDGVNDGDEVASGFNPVDPSDNRATADAGPDQTVPADPDGITQVVLDGTGSFDPNQDPLFFSWNLESSISEPASIVPRTGDAPAPVLNAAVGGDYRISLKVREDLENWVWSETDEVMIHVIHFISGFSPASATWGEEITITGAGFDKDAQHNGVTVGGAAAQVTAAAHDELKVIVPDGCSSGEVQVTVNGRACDPAFFHLVAPAGSFSRAPEANLPVLSDCSQAAAFGDVDNDGDLDLAVANMGGLDISVKAYEDPACASMDPQNRLYLNDGQGRFTDMTFGPDQVKGTADDLLPGDGDQSVDILLADLDQDGDLDMVIANQGAFIETWEFCGYGELETCTGAGEQNRIYINDGSGKFIDETGIRLPAVQNVTNDLALADVDNDGDLDLYAGNHKNCVPVPSWQRFPCQDYCCESYCRECIGFNCSQPCCTSCGEENCGWIWYGDGCENHPDSPCCNGFCDSCGEAEYLCYECCGFEGECQGFDCSSCCSDCGECPDNPGCRDRSQPVAARDRLYLNNGTGVFVEDTSIFLVDGQGYDDNYADTRSVAFADVDGDGALDLIRDGNTRSYNRICRYERSGGRFVRSGNYLDRSGNMKDILIEDFDGSADGLLDVFAPVYSTYGDYPVYLVQDPADTFTSHAGSGGWLPPELTFREYKHIVSSAAQDVNLDGLPDVILGRSGDFINTLFLTDGDRPGHMTYTPGMLPDIPAASFGTALGDVDGDGDPDLLFANSGQNVLLINNTLVPGSCDWDLEGADDDVDGKDLAVFIEAGDGSDLAGFAGKFGAVACSGN